MNYRDWRFATRVKGFTGSYFEVWLPISGGEYWYLLGTYLHIYFGGSADREIEYFALHCDPEEKPRHESGALNYKRGPHVHVKAAREPLPKVHLPLADGNLDKVLFDTLSVTSALRRGMLMLAHEVLSKGVPS
jgi:hypothetical protein